MPMSIHRNLLLKYLNDLLTPELFEDYAPNGLQIEGQEQISKIAFAVSATQDSLNKAIEFGAQALIVHHGVFWKYQGAKSITGPWGTRIKNCIKADINLIAYHLPLDAHQEFGNAFSLATEIGLEQIEPFGSYKKQFLGSKGVLNSPLTVAEFKLKLEKILNHSVIVASENLHTKIKSVGIITGGANNDWTKAKEDNLDAYVTGEISEYNWHDSIEAGINYFAGGHHATEKFGIQYLMKKIEKDNPQLKVKFIDSDNPA
jgi:dinuclear metal center YbgI/SA1388 family protein